jgi:NRAMP (natural resistance-associated macrophage protein)-like metal ion transporter
MRKARPIRRKIHHRIHRKSHSQIFSLETEINSKTQPGFQNKIQQLWQRFGPGIVTGASDDDPSGITTYSQAGASFGLQTLWTALLSFPLMAAIQEMCGRIGLVTNQGLTKVVKKHYPKWAIYLIGLVSVPAIVLNIAANLAGMGAVSNMLLPMIPTWVFIILSALAIMFSLVLFSYKKIEGILKWLTLVLLVYLVVPFFIKIDWLEVLNFTVIPHIQFTKEYIAIIVAILGTTISPYLFFWETSMEVEDHQALHNPSSKVAEENDILPVSKEEIKEMRQDNNLGMFISNFVMFFIILVTGIVLHQNDVTSIDSVQEAANALRPLAGDGAYVLFAAGIIGTGFLAIPVLAGACGYIVSEMFDWKEGMNYKFKQARGFYEVICFCILIGLGLNISGIDPIQGMIWSAIVYGLTAPVLIAIILHIANREDIMGKWKNGWLSNTLGILGFIIMTIAAAALVITSL